MSKTWLAVGVGAVLFFLLFLVVTGAFGFFAKGVDQNEVGLILHKGRVVEVVPAGIYTRWGIWWDMKKIDTEGKKSCAHDPEVLTSDKQPIGVLTCSYIHRPGADTPVEEYARIYGQYKSLLLDDEALIGTFDDDGILIREGMSQKIQLQSTKSCVGDNTFDSAAVGESRDHLSTCLDTRENVLIDGFGKAWYINNTTVPNIEIADTVQEKLDQITDEKFATDLRRQEELRIEAEASRDLAQRQGEIRVTQGEVQERQKQRAITAGLEEQAILAELVVIEASRSNELKNAELALGVAEAQLLVDLTNAEAGLAPERALIGLYGGEEAYLGYLVAVANAEAFGNMSKTFLTPGTSVDAVVSPDAIDVVVSPGG